MLLGVKDTVLGVVAKVVPLPYRRDYIVEAPLRLWWHEILQSLKALKTTYKYSDCVLCLWYVFSQWSMYHVLEFVGLVDFLTCSIIF